MVHKKKKKPLIQASTEIKGDETVKPGITTNRRARIIVRNLPFANLSDNLVRGLFSQYGNILDVNLLKKADGKYVGCGFVEFATRNSAAKAIARVNGKQLNGRPVIVDWALSKDTYRAKVQQTYADVKEEPTSDDDDKGGILDYSLDTKPDIKGGEDDDDEEEDEDYYDEDDEEEMDEDGGDEIGEPPRKVSNDVDEGKTVFIKNVPFSATNDDVKQSAQVYGSVLYALVCVDKLTEHSKGSAFVKFKEKASADKCMSDKTFTIKDQPVDVTMAVSKGKLEEEKKIKKMKTKDSRNLYLVREGVVMAGSPAAVTVSAADMAKRLQIEQWKTQILRNLNMFVSRNRIVVHNLPAAFNDDKFRKMVESNSRPGTVIKEARVMQDRKKFDNRGNAVSKEMAFVTFANHDDALYALRKINNNPNIFTESKRPIVSFSIENREILHLKQKRMEKSRAKVLGDKAKDKTLLKMNKKQRRFLRRKEKIIKLRQEAKIAQRGGKNEETSVKKGTGEKSPKKVIANSHNGKSTKVINGNSEEKRTNNASLNENKKKGTKRGKSQSEKFTKKIKVDVTPTEENTDDYSGTHSVPGKKLKMRSRLKLSKQAEIHKNRLKEVKKLKKLKKEENIRQQNRKEREVKTKQKKFAADDNFTKLINTYKNRIEHSTAATKWYDS